MNRPHLPRLCCALLLLGVGVARLASAATALADLPLYNASNVPANLMLALSVEYPTGVVAAYTDAAIPLVYTDTAGVPQTIACPGHDGVAYGDCFFPAMQYLGYFDYAKCYSYRRDDKIARNNYFVPARVLHGSGCPSGEWSGNMLNWATMTALDEFRQALTGGYRLIDEAGLTVLQRSRITGQGSFPIRRIGAGNPAGLASMKPSSVIGEDVFRSAATVYLRAQGDHGELSNTIGGQLDRGVFLQIADNPEFADDGDRHAMLYYVRVQVCVAGLLETNCNSAHAATDYPGAGAYDKPEGLIQQNYTRVRVGATGYLYADGRNHPNGVVRARLHDNGPTVYNGFRPRQSNPNREWDGANGILQPNPDPDAAHATDASIQASGALNYLNQFGLQEQGYEYADTLAELYWATLAYYKRLPLDAGYSAPPPPRNAIDWDGFPALFFGNDDPQFSNGNDPIRYSCQGNAIVTIGDSHIWCDTHVPGSATNANDAASGGYCSNHNPLPSLLSDGSQLDTAAFLSAIGKLALIEQNGSSADNPPTAGPFAPDEPAGKAGRDLGSSTEFDGQAADEGTFNLAGLAYYAHTQDIRPDLPACRPWIRTLSTCSSPASAMAAPANRFMARRTAYRACTGSPRNTAVSMSMPSNARRISRRRPV